MKKEVFGHMKAIIEFQLPQDQSEFILSTKAPALYSFVFDLFEWHRKLINNEIVEKEFIHHVKQLIEQNYGLLDDID